MQYEIINIISRDIDNALKQIESLYSLYMDLKFDKSLPITRDWAASPDLLLKLKEITMQKKPNIVIECSSGISTLVIAKCLEISGKGHVYSLEHDSKFAEITRQNLIKHNLEEYATIVNAPLVSIELNHNIYSWYDTSSLNIENVEMLVIDGPPGGLNKHARYPAFPVLRDTLASEAVIILDDSNRTDEMEIISKWLNDDSSLELGEKAYCEKGCVVLNYYSNK